MVVLYPSPDDFSTITSICPTVSYMKDNVCSLRDLFMLYSLCLCHSPTY
jgi:hypothetical protein